MRALPRFLRIASQRVQVRRYAHLYRELEEGHHEPLFGSFDTGAMEICLVRDMSPERQRLTLLHEVMHFAWSIARLPDDEEVEEAAVARLTPLLLSFLRDNPKAVEYLQEVL